MTTLMNIGFGNFVVSDRVVALVQPGSAPLKRLIKSAREKDLLIDATLGKPKRAVIIMDSKHVVLSAKSTQALLLRISPQKKERSDVFEELKAIKKYY